MRSHSGRGGICFWLSICFIFWVLIISGAFFVGCSSGGDSNTDNDDNSNNDPIPDDGSGGGGDGHSANKVNIGINITGWGGAGKDWLADKVWADAFRSHRKWVDTENNPIPLDENGWPTTDGSAILWPSLGPDTADNNGTYKLVFECDNPEGVSVVNTFSTSDGDDDLMTASKSVQGNTVSYDVVVTSPTENMKLRFQDTNGGVRNAKLMRPIAPGSSEYHAFDEVFYRPFLAALKPFGTLRYMHWMNIDDPLFDVNWSDRTPWTYATQQGKGGDDWPSSGSGPAWESVIMLANQTMTDCWINIPARATDDYIRQLAILFRDGNEYTEPLHPDLKLYVEYTNEHWNLGGYASQAAYLLEQGSNSSICRFDGETDENLLRRRYPGQRTVEMSLIFREVFGDAQMMTRIRPYLGHQLGYDDIINKTLSFMDRYYCGRSTLSDYPDPHSMNYYLYGLGCTTYYYATSPAEDLTIDNIWEDGTWNMDAHFDVVKGSAAWARSLYRL